MGTSATKRTPARARIVIADDHEVVRAGLRTILAGKSGFEIVGEAATGLEAVRLCRHHMPDLIIMDARMPELDGIPATAVIKRECPSVRVIILTMHESPDYLFQALKAGASGYLLKDAGEQQIISAVRRVLRGEVLLNPDLTTQVLRRLVVRMESVDTPAGERLTPREHQILGLIVQGKTNRQIAATLHVSVGTVKVHVEHIIAKLGVADRTQAAVRAIELGLLDPLGA